MTTVALCYFQFGSFILFWLFSSHCVFSVSDKKCLILIIFSEMFVYGNYVHTLNRDRWTEKKRNKKVEIVLEIKVNI